MTLIPTQDDRDTLTKLHNLEWLSEDGRPNPAALAIIARHAQEARRLALEEAAKVADGVKDVAFAKVKAGSLPYLNGIEADTARDIAKAIRGLQQ